MDEKIRDREKEIRYREIEKTEIKRQRKMIIEREKKDWGKKDRYKAGERKR